MLTDTIDSTVPKIHRTAPKRLNATSAEAADLNDLSGTQILRSLMYLVVATVVYV
jgi:hypothetical protein